MEIDPGGMVDETDAENYFLTESVTIRIAEVASD